MGIPQLGLVTILNFEMTDQQISDRVDGLTLVRRRVFLVELKLGVGHGILSTWAVQILS